MKTLTIKSWISFRVDYKDLLLTNRILLLFVAHDFAEKDLRQSMDNVFTLMKLKLVASAKTF